MLLASDYYLLWNNCATVHRGNSNARDKAAPVNSDRKSAVQLGDQYTSRIPVLSSHPQHHTQAIDTHTLLGRILREQEGLERGMVCLWPTLLLLLYHHQHISFCPSLNCGTTPELKARSLGGWGGEEKVNLKIILQNPLADRAVCQAISQHTHTLQIALTCLIARYKPPHPTSPDSALTRSEGGRMVHPCHTSSLNSKKTLICFRCCSSFLSPNEWCKGKDVLNTLAANQQARALRSFGHKPLG